METAAGSLISWSHSDTSRQPSNPRALPIGLTVRHLFIRDISAKRSLRLMRGCGHHMTATGLLTRTGRPHEGCRFCWPAWRCGQIASEHRTPHPHLRLKAPLRKYALHGCFTSGRCMYSGSDPFPLRIRAPQMGLTRCIRWSTGPSSAWWALLRKNYAMVRNHHAPTGSRRFPS